MHKIVDKLPGVNVYVDDIIIYGKGDTVEEASKDHDRNLDILLQKLRTENVKLNKDKIRYK